MIFRFLKTYQQEPHPAYQNYLKEKDFKNPYLLELAMN